jgi:hypothetical protein
MIAVPSHLLLRMAKPFTVLGCTDVLLLAAVIGNPDDDVLPVVLVTAYSRVVFLEVVVIHVHTVSTVTALARTEETKLVFCE